MELLKIDGPQKTSVLRSAVQRAARIFYLVTPSVFCLSIRLPRCILLVGTTARTSFLMDLIPYGGHKDAIRAWGHVHIVVLPYLMFALIVLLVVSCITLQATLTSRAVVGLSTGCFVIGLGAIFTFSWIRADRVLGVTLTSMVTKQSHTAGKNDLRAFV